MGATANGNFFGFAITFEVIIDFPPIKYQPTGNFFFMAWFTWDNDLTLESCKTVPRLTQPEGERTIRPGDEREERSKQRQLHRERDRFNAETEERKITLKIYSALKKKSANWIPFVSMLTGVILARHKKWYGRHEGDIKWKLLQDCCSRMCWCV